MFSRWDTAQNILFEPTQKMVLCPSWSLRLWAQILQVNHSLISQRFSQQESSSMVYCGVLSLIKTPQLSQKLRFGNGIKTSTLDSKALRQRMTRLYVAINVSRYSHWSLKALISWTPSYFKQQVFYKVSLLKSYWVTSTHFLR